MNISIFFFLISQLWFMVAIFSKSWLTFIAAFICIIGFFLLDYWERKLCKSKRELKRLRLESLSLQLETIRDLLLQINYHLSKDKNYLDVLKKRITAKKTKN